MQGTVKMASVFVGFFVCCCRSFFTSFSFERCLAVRRITSPTHTQRGKACSARFPCGHSSHFQPPLTKLSCRQ
jgi:hypothetical protein